MNRRLKMAGVLAATVVSLLGVAQSASANSFFDEAHNRNSGKCMNVRGDSGDAGAAIQQFHCDNTPAAKFRFNDLGGGFYQIEGQNSHKCVQPQTEMTLGSPLLQWFCQNAATQQWQLVPATGGSFQFKNRASNMCIDVPNWSSADRVVLQQWVCVDGAANQEFHLLNG